MKILILLLLTLVLGCGDEEYSEFEPPDDMCLTNGVCDAELSPLLFDRDDGLEFAINVTTGGVFLTPETAARDTGNFVRETPVPVTEDVAEQAHPVYINYSEAQWSPLPSVPNCNGCTVEQPGATIEATASWDMDGGTIGPSDEGRHLISHYTNLDVVDEFSSETVTATMSVPAKGDQSIVELLQLMKSAVEKTK